MGGQQHMGEGGWLNTLLGQLWPYLRQAMYQAGVGSVETAVEQSKVPYLQGLDIKRMELLGGEPIRIEGVAVREVAEEEPVMDLRISWLARQDIVMDSGFAPPTPSPPPKDGAGPGWQEPEDMPEQEKRQGQGQSGHSGGVVETVAKKLVPSSRKQRGCSVTTGECGFGGPGARADRSHKWNDAGAGS